MKNNQFIELSKIYEARYIEQEQVQKVQLPTIEEILKRKETNLSVLNEQEKAIIRKGYKQELIVYPTKIWDVSDSVHEFDNGFKVFVFSTKGSAESGAETDIYVNFEKFDFKKTDTDIADIRVNAEISLSALEYNGEEVDLKLFNFFASGELPRFEYELGIDLASVKWRGAKVNVGFYSGSGYSIREGSAKGKVNGIGISVGEEIGVSTPFGGVSLNLEETAEKGCVIQ